MRRIRITPAATAFLRSFCLIALAAGTARAEDPGWYRRGSTWEETLIRSFRALEAVSLEDGFEAFESDVVRGGEPARRVSVELAGAEELFLLVAGCPDVKWGVADWADARLIASDGTVTYLGDLESLEALKGRHSVDINLRSGLYEKLSIGGRGFERGICVQADSVLRAPLGGRLQRFEAWIGIDGWAGPHGNARFTVAGSRTAASRMLWDLVRRDFPDGRSRRRMSWHREDRLLLDDRRARGFAEPARRYAEASRRVPPLAEEAARCAKTVRDGGDLARVRELYYRSRRLDELITLGRTFDFAALGRAIDDLVTTYGDRYPEGPGYLNRLDGLRESLGRALARTEGGSLEDFEKAAELARELRELRREALLANPLLDLERLLVVRRTPVGDPRRSHGTGRGLGESIGLPRQSSWGNSTIPRPDTWENEIAVLSPVGPEGGLTTLFEPDGRRLITDVDLSFDGRRLLFSMPDERNLWQVWELGGDGRNLRQLTPGDQPDVHSYDACYLPSGDVVFVSTAPLQGVPCNPSVVVGMLYRMDAGGGNIRQLCFEQDHDYSPSVLSNGRVLYLRWDYTDTPHVWNRLLMSMNPDGTGQMEYYGGNSYWPNAIFYARAVPGHPTKVAGIVTGHHVGRVGELVVFDPSLGRHEADGVVQRIPGYGEKVEPEIEDKLTEHSWPKFVHPCPLSEKYFIVACKPEPDSLWGIYLVDVFDNRVLLREEEGRVLLEPIPFRSTPRPPVIAEKARPERDDALVSLSDIYRGPGLRGVPRGSVKRLRLFTYHFGYQTLAGIDHRIGLDGPWEVKRVLGTVPVEEDGSAFFRIPARTPISVQPLDEEGKALALMRSWMTAIPGEVLSCVGCHDRSGSPPNRPAAALRRPPSEIEPWRGPTRGFDFEREVQPVLDRHCAGCHDGRPREDGRTIPDLRRDQDGFVVYERGDPVGRLVRGVPRDELIEKYGGVFHPSYVELRRFVRVGGLESDLHILPPLEFHAGTSELVQMLRKGHGGVRLDEEAWDRLVTWIDLNAPCHGTWRETAPIPGNQRARRLLLRRLYGGVDEDAEEIPAPAESVRAAPATGVTAGPVAAPTAEPADVPVPAVPGWPFDAAEAKRRQAASGTVARSLELGGGVRLELVRVPAGSFVMGDPRGEEDERPLARVEISRPFWMSRCEVTNEQFARFDPAHESGFEHRSSWIFSEEYLGWPLDRPRQPVVRVSWRQAMEFCRWLSERTGERVTLPTEAQWEYACRAGTETPLSYGSVDADFSPHANVADRTIRDLAYEGWRPRAPDVVPRDDRFSDGALVTADVGSYAPNPWGLHDLHGNASEWTRTAYGPCPRSADAREAGAERSLKVVRGGSWRDRPKRCRSAFRLAHRSYQRVYNVGFRVIVEEGDERLSGTKKRTDSLPGGIPCDVNDKARGAGCFGAGQRRR